MDEKKRRLIDDDVLIGLINNFEAKQRLNGVMEKGICATSKAIAGVGPPIEHSIPGLTWLTKLLYLKPPQPLTRSWPWNPKTLKKSKQSSI